MKSKSLIKYGFYVLIIIQFRNTYSQDFTRIEAAAGISLKDNTGVAVADYDGDNDLDLFVVAKARDNNSEISHSKLYRNNNDGTFTDVTIEAGLTNLHPFEDSHASDPFNTVYNVYQEYKWGVSWGDYDNDGDPDLFFTNAYRVLLFKNLGNGTFDDVTNVAGFEVFNNCFNTSAVWFDYDKDGYLDIYISDYKSSCGRNSLFKNNGNGSFTNVSDLFTIENIESSFTFVSMPIDINNDGWLDLYLANDFGRNDLFINQNGTGFTEQSQVYGLDDNSTGMGLTAGDYNNDGLFDIYVSNIDRNTLFTNNGDGSYTRNANEMGVMLAGWAWGARFADFDLDGDEDLLVVNGYDLNSKNHNIYFKNLYKEGQNEFSNIASQVNLDEFSFSLTSAVFDFDNDGDLDIFITNKDDVPFFYKNNSIELNTPESSHWFKVKLEGSISNRDAIGTKIAITTNNNVYHRYYHGSGLYSQSLLPVHFGLGEDSEILELKITWPLGLVETYNNLAVNKTIIAKEGSGFEVLEDNTSEIVLGCTDPDSCNYNPLAIQDNGSCIYLDSKEISGNTNSYYLQTETYSYPISQSDSLNWAVTGGNVLEKTKNTITVKWGIEEIGKITVEEYDSCKSLPSELVINLQIPSVSDTINNQSVARLWNEALLEAIRGDYARPTIHARNLFHTSIAMYDAWAIYSDEAKPYLTGKTVHGFSSNLDRFTPNQTIEESRKKAISYAAYRLLNHRFNNSPDAAETKKRFDLLMQSLDYDINNTSTDYSTGDAAAFGNYIAEIVLNYGAQDGSRESTLYDNEYYQPVNDALITIQPGNATITDPNRWQPLSLDVFIDQSGHIIGETTPEFLSPEWGNVSPFSLTKEAGSMYQRSNDNYYVYNDPGNPPYIDLNANNDSSEAYKWGFSLVSIWGSHLDPSDNVMWDVSPNSMGNINSSILPVNFQDYPNFYSLLEGGDIGQGHAINPITNTSYIPQIVPRGDYTRVLAEFWADGPDSETPPGHWFTILNYVSDHPLLKKKIEGQGEVLDQLEWDVKSYFILGGTMHDAAIAAWSIKGWYDYIRPISAIRFMADKGQSSDPSKSNYNVAGIPLQDGYVEIVEEGDPLQGREREHIGKIKLYTWKGHNFIGDPSVDQAGVGWILAEEWWPYQRPSFVTPPFAGFVSGHSTYSRAAAEIMTLLTGDEYFPGGIGEFHANKNEFLVFEEGPSVDIKLQWATYRDASDQCSLSRIWGGIHPPADDIPGRLIGEKIGNDAFSLAKTYFNGKENISLILRDDKKIFPNPIGAPNQITVTNTNSTDKFSLFDIQGRKVSTKSLFNESNKNTKISIEFLEVGIYLLKDNKGHSWKIIVK